MKKSFTLPYQRSRRLVQAMARGDVSYVTSVVPKEVNVNQPIESYPGSPSTYLSMLAVANNSPDTLEYLIDVGANALVKDRNGMNIFSKVAANPNLDKRITDVLFYKENDGEYLNDQTASGNTVVHTAVLAKNVYTLSALLNMSKALRVATIRNGKGDTPLALALKTSGGNPTIPIMLINYATDVSYEPLSTTDARRNTAMDIAFGLDMSDVVEAIRTANCVIRSRLTRRERQANEDDVTSSSSSSSQEMYMFDDDFVNTPAPNSLAEEMTNLHSLHSNLRTELDSARARVAELEASLKESEMDRTAVNELITKTTEEYDSQIMDYISQVASLQTDVDVLTAAQEKWREEMESSRAEVAELKSDRNSLVGEVIQLKETAAEKDAAAILSLTKDLDALRVTSTSEEETSSTAEETDETISTERKKDRIKMDVLSDANARLTEEVETLRPLEIRVEGLIGELATARADLDQLNAELENVTKKLVAAEIELSKSKAASLDIISDNNKHIEGLLKKLDDKSEAIAIQTRTNKEQNRVNDALREEIRSASLTIANQQARMEAEEMTYSNRLAEKNARLEELTVQYETAMSQEREKTDASLKEKDRESAVSTAKMQQQLGEINNEYIKEMDKIRAEHAATLLSMTSEFDEERRLLQQSVKNARKEEYEKNYAMVTEAKEAEKAALDNLRKCESSLTDAKIRLDSAEKKLEAKSARMAKLMRGTEQSGLMAGNSLMNKQK